MYLHVKDQNYKDTKFKEYAFVQTNFGFNTQKRTLEMSKLAAYCTNTEYDFIFSLDDFKNNYKL